MWIRIYSYVYNSLNYSYNEKYLRQTLCRKSKHTFYIQKTFFLKKNGAGYVNMYKNTTERGRSQMTIWRICIACWAPKAKDKNTQYVIRQKWLQERATILRYTYFAYFSLHVSFFIYIIAVAPSYDVYYITGTQKRSSITIKVSR